MTKYYSKSQQRHTAWWGVDNFDVRDKASQTLTVLEGDAAIDTGLLDQDGNAILRSDKEPIGFVHWGNR